MSATTRLKILSNTVLLKYSDGAGWDTGSCGQMVEDSNTCMIKDNLSAEVECLTELHEITHCADAILAIGLSEAQVQQLAAYIFSLVRDNPKYIAKLQDA